MSDMPAGWYPDPRGSDSQRYWDGDAWSAHVVDATGQPLVDPVGTDAPSQELEDAPPPEDGTIPDEAIDAPSDVSEGETLVESATTSEAPGTPWYRRPVALLVGALAALLIAFGIGAAVVPKPKDQKAEVAALHHQVAKQKSVNEDLRAQVHNRAAQTQSDEAHAAAVAADQQKAAADAAAAAQKAAADKAAADKKAADDAAAAQAAAAAKMNTVDSDGVFAVGPEINPGLWHTDGGTNCYYAVLRSTDTQDIATNNIVNGPASVTLNAGQYFDTTRCGTWTRR